MKKIFIASAICVVAFFVQAQDIHFSQFTQSPLTINPAHTGATTWIRAVLNYRNQWNNVVPYNTIAASFDQKLKKRWHQREKKTRTLLFNSVSEKGLGWGVNVFNDRAGDGRMSTLQGNFSLAYQLQLAKEQMLSAGLQAGFVQRSINYNDLYWENQYDPGSSNGFNQSIASQENFSSNHFVYPDISAGMIYTYKKNERYMRGNDERDFQTGIAIFHANQPKYSFMGTNERLAPRMVFHSNGVFGISNTNMALAPGFLFQQQGGNRELYAGSLLRYMLKEDSKYTGYVKGAALSVGGYYRNKDAVVAAALFEFSSYAIGMSYDFNISKLKAATTGRGGVEIVFRFLNPAPFLFSKASFN